MIDLRLTHGITGRDLDGEVQITCAPCGVVWVGTNSLPEHECSPDGRIDQRIARSDVWRRSFLADLRMRQEPLL